MSHVIRNFEELVSKGGSGREVALKLLEEGLRAADPQIAVKRSLVVEGDNLLVRGIRLDLSKIGRIIVVGAGKASGFMAKAVEEVLDDRINEGFVIVPKGSPLPHLKKVKLWEADHPIPSERGVEGAKKITRLVREVAGNDTLIITLISGGGSALMPLPAEGISLEDKKELTRLLLKSGASIDEINVVRKHVSAIKGGRLAKLAYPSRLISLIVSDVVGDRLDLIASGPTSPDPSTFSDALNIIKRYGLENKVPPSILNYILRGVRGEVPESPKPGDSIFNKVNNVIVASNRLSLTAMKEVAERLGYRALFLTSYMEGEARHVGRFLSSICKEIYYNDVPVRKPAVILAGGETTVTVIGRGKGGRNQELVLGAFKGLSDLRNVVLASIGSDGIDGVTDAAGALLDENVVRKAKELRLDPDTFLADNDSYTFFRKIGDGLIYTGYTGTNVNDLTVACIGTT
ncbi:MAG: hydroxypyruvate reductase [Thermofilum sp. ex4484_15]|nr:MAG: hydroxypyruvate reductase [Thermofilum sp. ex4484_15]